ncbi:MAG: hypothetical protein J0L97_02975 [Alphaproteobacteria bacterium]|nr:hypothetical protein [Alphaproteobacteria bacterium]
MPDLSPFDPSQEQNSTHALRICAQWFVHMASYACGTPSDATRMTSSPVEEIADGYNPEKSQYRITFNFTGPQAWSAARMLRDSLISLQDHQADAILSPAPGGEPDACSLTIGTASRQMVMIDRETKERRYDLTSNMQHVAGHVQSICTWLMQNSFITPRVAQALQLARDLNEALPETVRSNISFTFNLKHFSCNLVINTTEPEVMNILESMNLDAIHTMTEPEKRVAASVPETRFEELRALYAQTSTAQTPHPQGRFAS